MKDPRMCHERGRGVIRRAALALLPWLCLATAGPGCSPAGPAPNGAAGTPDRLDKMRALRGTGGPRRPSIPARQESGPPVPRQSPRVPLAGHARAVITGRTVDR
jgi:hypothetical protein